MEDIRSILSSHNPKGSKSPLNVPEKSRTSKKASSSEIPDLFFDEILVQYKLTRLEIIVLMYYYRLTWCKPNLYRKFGIGPIVSYEEIITQMGITMEDLHQCLRKLESFNFVETIRPGQYFIRKYFTEENDTLYGQTYDDFF